MGTASFLWLESFTKRHINSLFVTSKKSFCSVVNERLTLQAQGHADTHCCFWGQGARLCPAWERFLKWGLLLWCLRNLLKRFTFLVPQRVLCGLICQWVLIDWIVFLKMHTIEWDAMSTSLLSQESLYNRIYWQGCRGVFIALDFCQNTVNSWKGKRITISTVTHG